MADCAGRERRPKRNEYATRVYSIAIIGRAVTICVRSVRTMTFVKYIKK